MMRKRRKKVPFPTMSPILKMTTELEIRKIVNFLGNFYVPGTVISITSVRFQRPKKQPPPLALEVENGEIKDRTEYKKEIETRPLWRKVIMSRCLSVC